MISDSRQAQHELAEKIKQIRLTPGADNKPVLAVNIEMLQRAKNGGYPKHLYHATMTPVVALSDKEEQVYFEHGYQANYSHRDFPKWLYRRNTDPRFALSASEIDHQHKVGGYLREPFVEAVQVNTKEEETVLIKKAKPSTAGPWEDAITDLEALPDSPAEDHEVTIARLQGQLEEAQRQRAAKG